MSGGSTVFTTRLALVEFSFDRNRNKTSIRFVFQGGSTRAFWGKPVFAQRERPFFGFVYRGFGMLIEQQVMTGPRHRFVNRGFGMLIRKQVKTGP